MISGIATINKRIELLPAGLFILLSLLLTVIVGYFDYRTGPFYSFSLFYLLIVVATAWYKGRKFALVIAIAGTLAWFVAALLSRQYDHYPDALYWNDLVELVHFLFAAYVISMLKNALDCSERRSRSDSLTGIANRRLFYEVADAEILRAHRTNEPFTIMYLDIDNFKTVNDTQGHDAGDELLIAVAATVKHQLRESDTVARLGGDEFSVLLPVTTEPDAAVVVRKIKHALADSIETKWPVTFSIGMVTYMQAPESVETMIREADQVMYEVKKSGKNELRSIVIHESQNR